MLDADVQQIETVDNPRYIKLHLVLVFCEVNADLSDVVLEAYEAPGIGELTIHVLASSLTPGFLSIVTTCTPHVSLNAYRTTPAALTGLNKSVDRGDLVWFPSPFSRTSPSAFLLAHQAFEDDEQAAIAVVDLVVAEDGAVRRMLHPLDAVCSVIEGILPFSSLIFAGRAFDHLTRACAASPNPTGVLLSIMQGAGRAIALAGTRLILVDQGQFDGMGFGPQAARRHLVAWRATYKTREARRLIYEGWAQTFVLIDSMMSACTFVDDCSQTSDLSLAELVRRFVSYMTLPHACADILPTILVLTRRGIIDELSQARVKAWVFDDIMRSLESSAVTAYNLNPSSKPGLQIVREPRMSRADLIAIKSNTLAEVVAKSGLEWLNTMSDPVPDFDWLNTKVASPLFKAEMSDHAVPALEPESAQNLLARLCVRLRRSLPLGYSNSHFSTSPARHVFSYVSERLFRILFDEAPYVLREKLSANINIVMCVPVFSFGGVERVALNVARELRLRRHSVTVVVTHGEDFASHSEGVDAFDEIYLLRAADPASTSLWSDDLTRKRLERIVCQADVFIPSHVADWTALSAVLRGHEIPAIPYLHLTSLYEDGTQGGHPNMARDVIPVIDGAIVISRSLQSWLSAFGLSRDSICLAYNGPSRKFDEHVLSRSVAAKIARAEAASLKVLYIGRLDREKGLDRLEKIAQFVGASDGHIELRFVGAPVLDAGALPVAIEERRKAPVYLTSDLAAEFEWADVLLMASFAEGVPLVLLEAMQFGCVPVVTNVGAISEVVDHRHNGLLVDPDVPDVATELLNQLDWLKENPRDMKRLVENAASSIENDRWSRTADEIEPFLRHLVQRSRRGENQ